MKKGCNKKILIGIVAAGIFFSVLFFILKKVNNKNEEPENRFSKGVLAINTNKSYYKVNEKVEIGMASLDYKGDTLCKSNLKMIIKNPDGKEEIVSTSDDGIFNSSTCDENNNVTNNPDYLATFYPTKEGEYILKLINEDNGNEKETKFEVKSNIQYDIERSGATRINPFKADRYPMIIKVTSDEDFKGQLVENIPVSFDIVWQGNSTINENDNYKTITWDLDLKAGESKEFIYEYQPPKTSPEFYTLGAVKIIQENKKIFEEVRHWQIASDAVAFNTSSESHTGTTGSTNQTSFTWQHSPSGTPQGVVVFVYTWADADYVSTVTYGGVTMTEISQGEASDTATEPGRVTTFFLGSSVPTGNQNVVVNRTNNSTTMYATAATVTASYDTEVYTSGIVLLEDNGTYGVQSVSDGSPGSNSLRFAAGYSGRNAALSAGTGSTAIQSIVVGSTTSANLARENTAGQGSRNVGFSYNTSDDRAGVHLAIREKIPLTISGKIYGTDETTAYNCSSGGPYTVYVRVDGAGTYSTTCTLSSGAWSASISATSGQTIYAYIYGETIKGNTVLISNGTSKNDVNIMVDRVTIRDDADSIITNSEILAGNTSDSDDLITSTGTDVVVSSSAETHIYTGDTYDPGSNVSTGKLHVVGKYDGKTETLTLTGSGTGTSRPLYVTDGPFVAPDTTSFKGTGNSSIEATTYNNLTFTPTITGNVTYTSLGTLSINGNLTLNPTASSAYTLTLALGGPTNIVSTGTTTVTGTTQGLSKIDTVNNYTLTTGYLNIAAAGTLDANNSTINLNGTTGTIFTRTGTFDLSGGVSTVRFDQSTGDITLTSGAITFDNMVMSMPECTGSLGASITINNNLTIDSGTLNDAGYQIIGTSGGNFLMSHGTNLILGTTTTATSFPTNFINTGCFLENTSTVTYTAGINQTVSNAPTYGNLTISPTITTNRTYTFSGATTIEGNLIIQPSSSSASNTLLVNMGGNITISDEKTLVISGNTANSILDTINSYNITSGYLNIQSTGTLRARNSTITLTGHSGVLFTRIGTFDVSLGTSTVLYQPESGFEAPASWYNENWLYRLKITVLASQVDEDLSNFPVYVKLSNLPLAFHSNVRSDGGDIRITTSNGTTEIPREVVFYESATRKGEVHFKANIDSDTNTDFYIYYGNSSATEPAAGATYGRENVWTNSYVGVWHLQETANNTSGGYMDSTANNRDGTGVSMTSSPNAVMGRGQYFDGVADYINTTYSTNITRYTVQTWISSPRIPSNASPAGPVHREGNYQINWDHQQDEFRAASGVKVGSTWYGAKFDASLANTWYQLLTTYDGDTLRAYTNGYLANENTTPSGNPASDSNTLKFGRHAGSAQYFGGSVDEIRIASVVRTSGWISTEYHNQYSPSSFYLVSTMSESPDLYLNSSQITFDNVIVDLDTNTGILGESIIVNETISVISGTMDTSTNNYEINTVNLSITGPGEINARGSTINVSGNWSNYYGTYTPGTSSVNFSNSSNHEIYGNTNFYNLSILSTTAPATISLVGGGVAIHIISGGTLNMYGTAGSLLTIETDSEAPWYIDVSETATYNIHYVDVTKSNAGGYRTIIATDGTSIDSGRNINWIFTIIDDDGVFTHFTGIDMGGVNINK